MNKHGYTNRALQVILNWLEGKDCPDPQACYNRDDLEARIERSALQIDVLWDTEDSYTHRVTATYAQKVNGLLLTVTRDFEFHNRALSDLRNVRDVGIKLLPDIAEHRILSNTVKIEAL